MNKLNYFFIFIVILKLLVTFCSVDYDKQIKVDNKEVYTLKKAVYRKLITPESLIKKYNKVLLENNMNEINLEYLTNIDNTYYIGLYQDIILFVTPHECNDIKTDIVYQTGIIIDEETNNLDLAKLYYEYLIQANNEFIFNANELVQMVVDGNLVEKNNGLILASIINDGEINLFIERKYNS